MLCPSSGASVAESGVAGQVAGQDISGGFKLFADETQAEEPSPHCVFGVLILLGLRAGGSDFLGHLAQCQAKLDVALELACVDSALAGAVGGVELEKPELDRSLGEGCVGG